MAIRSGRFKIAGTAAEQVIPIISGHSGAFYRFYNSGSEDFHVVGKGGGGSDELVVPTFSLDVAVGTDVSIKVAANTDVEGIYEYLSTAQEVRSGRFKFDYRFDADGKPQPIVGYPHKIVDLNGGGDEAWYRLYNSGQSTIVLKVKGKADVAVKEDQSFDFEVGKNLDVFVTSADVDHKEPISGMYDFLGRS